MIFLNDHKVGFILSSSIAAAINKYYHKKVEIKTFYKFWNYNDENKKYIAFVRNPYEIIVSGYLYHKKCTEHWAINKNINYFDGWLNHFNKEDIYKNKILIDSSYFSKQKTYQEILNSIPTNHGIFYEMVNVSNISLSGISEFSHFDKSNVYVCKFENFIIDFKKEVFKILEFLGIENENVFNEILNYDLKKEKEFKSKIDHITNNELNLERYKSYFDLDNYKLFNVMYGESFKKLGYVL